MNHCQELAALRKSESNILLVNSFRLPTYHALQFYSLVPAPKNKNKNESKTPNKFQNCFPFLPVYYQRCAVPWNYNNGQLCGRWSLTEEEKKKKRSSKYWRRNKTMHDERQSLYQKVGSELPHFGTHGCSFKKQKKEKRVKQKQTTTTNEANKNQEAKPHSLQATSTSIVVFTCHLATKIPATFRVGGERKNLFVWVFFCAWQSTSTV